MKVSEIAQRAGCSAKAVRHYERLGLIRAHRTAGGYREFGPEALEILAFVAAAKEAGLKLREVAELLKLADCPPERCERARRSAQAELARIEAEIKRLTARTELLRAILAAPVSEAPGQCPMILVIARELPERR